MFTSAALFPASFLGFKKKPSSTEMWQEIIEFSENGKVVFDQSGAFLHANRKAGEYFPFLRDKEFSDLRVGDFFDYLYDHATDVDRSVHNVSQDYVSDGRIYTFREVVRVDGGILCLIRGKKLKSGQTVFIMDDISTNHKREEKVIDLGKENYHLTQAIEAATSGIFVSDPKAEGNPIIFVNDALCGFLDAPRSDLVGADWGAILRIMKDKEEREKLIKALAEAKEADLEACYKNGEQTRWYSVKVSPVRDADGNLDLLVGVLGDMTLLKQREAEFFHSQKLDALGQLAAGIAHDFNNVLSIIDGFSVMTASLVEDNEKAKDFLKRIQIASQRGAALTRKMLTFSRHKVVTQTVIDLCTVLKEQEGLLKPLLDATVELVMRAPEQPVLVKCGADSIGQIVMNLAINSRDAMPDGGKLVVGLYMSEVANVPQKIRGKLGSGDIACLEVTDTGSGMDAKTLGRIFDPFFTTKEQGKGTGLGMSVVYGLVQEIGGAIDIHSIEGQGTTISVYMPVSADGVVRQIRGSEADLKTICLDGYTALVAEDEPDLRMLVGKILEDMGMKVLCAESGDDALCVQDEHDGDIDILLTDVVMPGMNGVKLAELFSSLRPESKIIFMSGYPASGDMAKIRIPEGAYFVAKPVNYDNLAALVLKRLREGAVSENEALMVEAMPRWVNTQSQENEESHAA